MLYKNFIPLASPDIRESDIQNVTEVLRSGMLIQGKYCEKLEKQFADVIQVANAITVSNGTATMHLVLKSLGIGVGDEVIVPAFSYVASANVVELVGATPIFVDIDLETFNINVSKIEAKISAKTKAIIPVHEFGLACDIEAILPIAQQYNLIVIEDAACALGATQNKKPVGSFGKAGSFSLHPRKSITSGEGGIITTNDDLLTKKLRQLRNHGIEMESGKMVFEEAGFNYRLTDFQAALATGQMERLQYILQRKNQLSTIYFNHITNPKLTLPTVPTDRNHTWQTFHILLDNSLDQQTVINELKDKNIGSNYGAQCIPFQKYYQEKYKENAPVLYPNAYKAYTKGLAIPLYEKLTEEQLIYISNQLNKL